MLHFVTDKADKIKTKVGLLDLKQRNFVALIIQQFKMSFTSLSHILGYKSKFNEPLAASFYLT